MKIVARTANEAMAEAMRQVNPDVVAAYPITPATEIVQIFSSFVHDGLVDTEFIAAESEHSAMSACIGAAASGARVMTGTAAQGLALMDELLYIAAGLRLPIVLCEINRALSAPINIHCDHSDTMNVRDSGWIQIYSEDSQEVYDSVIQAVRIAEEVFLPVLVTADGFILSHAMQRIEMLDDADVEEFIGENKSPYNLLDINNPITVGSLDLQDYYFEHKYMEAQAMLKADKIIEKVAREFDEKFGRYYGLIEKYKLDDADYAIVVMGSTAGTAKETVDYMREKGEKVGLLRLRVYRPFPAEEIKNALKNCKVVGVLDRADGFNAFGGPVYIDIKAALYDEEKRPNIHSFIYGLGGRDIKPHEIEDVFNMIKKGKLEKINYIGVRV